VKLRSTINGEGSGVEGSDGTNHKLIRDSRDDRRERIHTPAGCNKCKIECSYQSESEPVMNQNA
jgi:hypothetical protein